MNDGMVIDCGVRRIKRHPYGWKIEVLKKSPKTGKESWEDDRPAYPSSLAQALQNVLERTLADGPDIEAGLLAHALRRDLVALEQHLKKCGRLADDIF